MYSRTSLTLPCRWMEISVQTFFASDLLRRQWTIANCSKLQLSSHMSDCCMQVQRPLAEQVWLLRLSVISVEIQILQSEWRTLSCSQELSKSRPDAIQRQRIRRHEKNQHFWATLAASKNWHSIMHALSNAHANHIIFDLNISTYFFIIKYLGGLFNITKCIDKGFLVL